ncbi:MAG TPA: hypothetical protein VGM30_10295 [Puia sp.]|jgi:hypothetical protein
MKKKENLYTQLTWTEFEEKFSPQRNHLVESAAFNDFMYETYGQELEYVEKQDPLSIWTVLDGDGSVPSVVSGFHFINRLGYIIAEVPRTPEEDVQEIEVVDPEDIAELLKEKNDQESDE